MNQENSQKEIQQEFLEIQLLPLEFLHKYGDIIYL
jgi:hypothetical protein